MVIGASDETAELRVELRVEDIPFPFPEGPFCGLDDVLPLPEALSALSHQFFPLAGPSAFAAAFAAALAARRARFSASRRNSFVT